MSLRNIPTLSAIYYKYSTLPHGILIYIAPRVGTFPGAEGRGKNSLPRVQYVLIIHKEGLNYEYLIYYIGYVYFTTVQIYLNT